MGKELGELEGKWNQQLGVFASEEVNDYVLQGQRLSMLVNLGVNGKIHTGVVVHFCFKFYHNWFMV